MRLSLSSPVVKVSTILCLTIVLDMVRIGLAYRKSGDGSWTEYIRRQNTARSCSAVQEIMARICSERINEGIRFTFLLEMDDQ